MKSSSLGSAAHPSAAAHHLRLFVRVRRIYCDLKFVSHVPTLTPTTDT